VEFLSDNGPEYIKTELRWFLKCAGFVVCNTPIRSPESNGIAESFFKTFKRDYVYQNVCESFEDIKSKIGGWVEDYNTKAPHSALGMLSPSKFYANWKVKK
jgi:transposase InsO family protein